MSLVVDARTDDGHDAVDASVTYKAIVMNALYGVCMSGSGDLRVSSRGQMSLPAEARHRWGLEGGGEVGYLDLGDAVLLVPGGVGRLRRELFEAVTEQDWRNARAGFGDPDIATQ